jgi:hypothetical protein
MGIHVGSKSRKHTGGEMNIRITIEQAREAWRRYQCNPTDELREEWKDKQRIATRLQDMWLMQPAELPLIIRNARL